MEALKNGGLDWSISGRMRAGETESGDRSTVIAAPGGGLMALADGLGHGAEAARAADLAVHTVEQHATLPLMEIMKRCHTSLVRTRGVALSLARWEAAERKLTWLGVGNVEGILLLAGDQRPESHRLVQRGGVVGVRLPTLMVTPLAVSAPALLILASDGVGGGFERGLNRHGTPAAIADQILTHFWKDNDDGTVLVARLTI